MLPATPPRARAAAPQRPAIAPKKSLTGLPELGTDEPPACGISGRDAGGTPEFAGGKTILSGEGGLYGVGSGVGAAAGTAELSATTGSGTGAGVAGVCGGGRPSSCAPSSAAGVLEAAAATGASAGAATADAPDGVGWGAGAFEDPGNEQPLPGCRHACCIAAICFMQSAIAVARRFSFPALNRYG